MKVTVKRGSKGLWKKRAKAISRGLEAIAREGARTAELHAKRGAMLNVYNTDPADPPNGYVRTKNLLRQVYAAGHANATSIGILVGDRAPYASFVELGTGPYELSEAQLAAYLEDLPRGGLLSFGRSGKAYMRPGPYIGPAMQYARTLTRERFVKLMEGVWQ